MRFLRFVRFLSLSSFEKTGQSPLKEFAQFFWLGKLGKCLFHGLPSFYNVENWAMSILSVCPVFLALKTGQMCFLRFAQFLSLPSFEKTGQSPLKEFAQFFWLGKLGKCLFHGLPSFYNVKNWAMSILSVCPVFLAFKTGQMCF